MSKRNAKLYDYIVGVIKISCELYPRFAANFLWKFRWWTSWGDDSLATSIVFQGEILNLENYTPANKNIMAPEK